MQEQTISNKNIEIYRKFLLIKEKELYDKKNKNKIENISKLYALTSIICWLASVILASHNAVSIQTGYMILSLSPISVLTGLVSQIAATKYFLRKEFNEFREKHPEFDINTSVDDIVKALEKTKQPVKISDMQDMAIEEQQQTNNTKKDFTCMTADERVELLKELKELIVQIENYEPTVQETTYTTGAGIQKKIGSINN